MLVCRIHGTGRVSPVEGPASEITEPGRWRSRASQLVWGGVVPVLLILGLAWFVWSERTVLAAVMVAPAGVLLLIAALFALGHLLNSAEFWILYRATGTRIGFMENWMLFTAGQLANHLPAQVGTVYRLRYMRRVHQVPYLHSAAVYGANLLITVEAAALVGLVGVIGATVAAGLSFAVPLAFLFGAMVAGATLFALVPLPPLRSLTGRFARFWRRFHIGFEEIRRQPRTASGVVALEAVKYGVTAWRIQVTFSLIGIDEPIWLFLVLAPAAGIAGFIAVTPGALGFREAFITGAAAAMGLELTEGLLGATVDRGVMLVTSLLLGSIGLLVTYPRFHPASVLNDTLDGPSESSDGQRRGAHG